jgi:EcsC protein family
MQISPSEIEDLRLAKGLLENPGLAAKLSDVFGAPIEKGLDLLPKRWNSVVVEATRKSIEKALDVALWTLDPKQHRGARSNWWHKLAVGTSGAIGGAFGIPALAVELPIATTIMLRSIADIGRGEGEDMSTAEFRVECVHVLALGGKSDKDDAAETGYFAARAAMATAVSEAIRHVAERGISQHGAPAIVRLITMVASRFSINVTEKAAAQAVPVVGSIGGALVNTLFIDHFQDIARGHFIVRRLERAHGVDEVKRAYAAIDVGT